MAPTLYMMHLSPPARAVLMSAKAIGLDLKLKEVDLLSGEHLQPDYLKINSRDRYPLKCLKLIFQLNPQHAVPTLVDDDGFTLSDSHAIMAYLVSKYAKNDSLYPKDLKRRAAVNQRLHFDSGVAFIKMIKITRPVILGAKSRLDQDDTDSVNEAFAFLETFLDTLKWTAGDQVSIADYSLIATISSINSLIPVDPDKFPKVVGWMKKCEDLPKYRENVKGVKIYEAAVKSRLKQ